MPASTNSELNLKAIFQPRRFWDASNNKRMASALPCLNHISIGTFRVDPFFYYVLFLLLYWELLYVLLDVKPIVDLFLSFVEFFHSWIEKLISQ
jgi:hypothetical protein